jgi:lipoprotein NlpD
LLLGACADTADEGPESYVVRPQDTLYSIAWRHDLDYRDLARWNNIGADFHISVGHVLVLGPGRAPSPDSRVPRAAATAGPAAGPRSGSTSVMPAPGRAGSGAQDTPQVGKPRPLPGSPASALSNTAPGASSAPSTRAASPALGTLNGPDIPGSGANAALKWVWPTDRVGAPRPVPGGGILLSGRLGQDVRAASAGRVVYTGSGLRGYGNLIIIKHADNLLSAYAHNREMLVHDGQEVAVGQVIAHMGEGARQSPILYFEIRQNGRPVDPLPFLSRAN